MSYLYPSYDILGLDQNVIDRNMIPSKDMLIIDANLMDCPLNSWCIDSGATSHICNTLQGFKETRRLNKREKMC